MAQLSFAVFGRLFGSPITYDLALKHCFDHVFLFSSHPLSGPLLFSLPTSPSILHTFLRHCFYRSFTNMSETTISEMPLKRHFTFRNLSPCLVWSSFKWRVLFVAHWTREDVSVVRHCQTDDFVSLSSFVSVFLLFFGRLLSLPELSSSELSLSLPDVPAGCSSSISDTWLCDFALFCVTPRWPRWHSWPFFWERSPHICSPALSISLSYCLVLNFLRSLR